jgi:CubicO group peptidase (beta-lactamase class C family)
LDLPNQYPTPCTGLRDKLPILNEVHDPNAYNLNCFTSHAGVFSNIQGLCLTLLNYEEKTNLISELKNLGKTQTNRFVRGWDRVENPNNTLAGFGCSQNTFGHLGFTGTSVWIDCDKKKANIILTNATKKYWYEKQGLNDLRRAIGEIIWQS